MVDLISENRNTGKQLEDYRDQKGTLDILNNGQVGGLEIFLGLESMATRGLTASLSPLSFRMEPQLHTERAVPTALEKQSLQPSVMKHYLRRWLKGKRMYTWCFTLMQLCVNVN